MKAVKACGYAKVNLFLDVVSKDEQYHMLDTVVYTVSLKDTASATVRSDKKIIIKEDDFFFTKPIGEDTNAYKAAKLFMDTFDTFGANITLNREIPIGSGLGGSSADIVAVLKVMKKLYMIDCDLKPLADKLGSDSGYLLNGGCARLLGRGDIVKNESINTKLWMLIITAEGGVTAKECFDKYDEMDIESFGSGENILKSLQLGIIDKKEFYNALYLPACQLNPNIETAYRDMCALSPTVACMSGSGSSVYGIFDNYEVCLWAKNKVRKKYKKAFIVETLTAREISILEKKL